jgi:hypothetical protein
MTETDPVFEILESGIGAQRIERGSQEHARVEPFVVGPLQPGHRPAGIAERRVDDRDLGGVRIARLGSFLQVVEQSYRVAPPPGFGERPREVGAQVALPPERWTARCNSGIASSGR